MKIVFDEPLTVGDLTLTRLEFRPAVVGDLLAAERTGKLGSSDQDLALVALLSGQSVEVLKRLPVKYWGRIRAHLASVYLLFYQDGGGEESPLAPSSSS